MDAHSHNFRGRVGCRDGAAARAITAVCDASHPVEDLLQPRVDGLTLEGQYAEHALVPASERLAADRSETSGARGTRQRT